MKYLLYQLTHLLHSVPLHFIVVLSVGCTSRTIQKCSKSPSTSCVTYWWSEIVVKISSGLHVTNSQLWSKYDEDGGRTRGFFVKRWINARCINMWFPGAWWKNQVFRSENLLFWYTDWKTCFLSLKYLVFR